MFRSVCLILAGVFYAGAALAHGGYDPRLKVAMSEAELRLEISLPASKFLDFDSDADGQLQMSEFQSRYPDLTLLIENRLGLHRSDGARVQPSFSDATIVDGDHYEVSDAVDHIKIRRRYKVEDFQGSLELTSDLYDTFPILVFSRVGQFEQLIPLKLCLETSTGTACQDL